MQTNMYSLILCNVNTYLLSSCLDVLIFSSPVNHHRFTAPLCLTSFPSPLMRIFYFYLKIQPTLFQANCLFPNLSQTKLNTSNSVFLLDLTICTSPWTIMVTLKYDPFSWKSQCSLHLYNPNDSHRTYSAHCRFSVNVGLMNKWMEDVKDINMLGLFQ